jgi:transglutaminase superfamily protein
VPGRIPEVRAAFWTLRALGRARRQLRREGMGRLDLPAPPALPESAVRGVLAALRRRPTSCLERALVLQRWYAAHGRPRDVVIGVAGSSKDFRAHAWLDGDRDSDEPWQTYRELSRVPAP